MDANLIKTLGDIAGIGGISVGALIIIFRNIIAKNIFPTLKRDDAYKLIRLIVILSFIVAAMGIIAKSMPGQLGIEDEVYERKYNYEQAVLDLRSYRGSKLQKVDVNALRGVIETVEGGVEEFSSAKEASYSELAVVYFQLGYDKKSAHFLWRSFEATPENDPIFASRQLVSLARLADETDVNSKKLDMQGFIISDKLFPSSFQSKFIKTFGKLRIEYWIQNNHVENVEKFAIFLSDVSVENDFIEHLNSQASYLLYTTSTPGNIKIIQNIIKEHL